MDPESNKIFSNLLNFTAPMVVSTIMLVTGVTFPVGGVTEALFLALFLLIDSDLGSKFSAM